MAKYRARFDGKAYRGPMWLTNDNTLSFAGAAVVGSLNEIVSELVDMVRAEPDTVRDGKWTLERKRSRWVEMK